MAQEALSSTEENTRQETAIEPDDCRKQFEQDSLESLFGAAGKQRDKLRQLFESTSNETVKTRLTHIAVAYHLALQGEASRQTTTKLDEIMTTLTDKMLSDKLGRKSVFGSHQPSRDKEYQEVKLLENRLVSMMEDNIGHGPSVVADHLLKQVIQPFIIGYLEQKLNGHLTAESRADVMRFIDNYAWDSLNRVRKGIETYHTGAIDKTYRAIDAILVVPNLLNEFVLDPAAPVAPDAMEIAPPADALIPEPIPDRAGDNVPPNENGGPPNGSEPGRERATTGNVYNTYNNFVYSPTNNTYAPVNMTFSPTTVTVNNNGIPTAPGRPDTTRPESPVFAVPPRTAVPDTLWSVNQRPGPQPAANIPADTAPSGGTVARRLKDVRVITPKPAPLSQPQDAGIVITATSGSAQVSIVNSQPLESGAPQYAAPLVTPQAPRTSTPLQAPQTVTPPQAPAIPHPATGAPASSAAVETAKVTLTNQGRQLTQLPRKAPQVQHFNRPITGSGTVQSSRITSASVVRQRVTTDPASTAAASTQTTVGFGSVTTDPMSIVTHKTPVMDASQSVNVKTIPVSRAQTSTTAASTQTTMGLRSTNIDPVSANPGTADAVLTPGSATSGQVTGAPGPAATVETAKITLTNQGRQLSQLPRKAPRVRHFNRPVTGSGTIQPPRITPVSLVRQPTATAPASITTVWTSTAAPRPDMGTLKTKANIEMTPVTLTNQGRQLSQLPRQAPRVQHFNRPATGSGTTRPAESLAGARGRLKTNGSGPMPKWLSASGDDRRSRAAKPATNPTMPAARQLFTEQSISTAPIAPQPITDRLATTVPAQGRVIQSQPLETATPQYSAPLRGLKTPQPASAQSFSHRAGQGLTDASPTSGKPVPRREPIISDLAAGKPKVVLSNEGLRRPGHSNTTGSIPHRAPLNQPAESLADARGRLKKSGPGPVPEWLMDNETEQPVSGRDK